MRGGRDTAGDRYRRLPAVPLTAISLLLSMGCGPARPGAPAPPAAGVPASAGAASGGSSAALLPGDAVAVEIWRQPDLTGQFPVDERGVVVFPLLGERTVTGLPPDSLRERLVGEYRAFVRNPSVRVTLLRRLNILGEVRQPGLYPVDATVTVADALALAGGVSPTGNPGDIRLLRGGTVVRRRLSQTSLLASQGIRSGDQIFVGEKGWLSRNVPLVTSLIGAATAVTVAIVLR